MKLEAITCCVDYADFLAQSLPLNRGQFDRMVVVTAPEDIETQRVCRYYGVPMVLSDLFRSRWGEFHKARGINAGLRALDLDGWVLHLDADIVLPPTARRVIERAQLAEWMLYGADRFLVQGTEQWATHQAMPALQQEDYHVHMDAFPVCRRFAGERMGGYAPPGYFQLWHPEGSGIRSYPPDHDGGNKTDVMFASKWARRARALLPELVVYHLESEAAEQGANWGGRQTARFGPEPEERHRPNHRQHRHRHHHRHRHRGYGSD